MGYRATVIPIMIASPGDVSEEREIIREVIHDWNDVNSMATKMVLTAVGWETHASPELGERPQELINSRVLKECDILVGVFWTRFGTPTGMADSGTQEEIDRHVAAGKPAMIYFSSRPVAPDSIDEEQYKAVKMFKNRCQMNGLVEVYDNPIQFKSKFAKQLQVCIHSNHYLRTILEYDGEGQDVAVSENEPQIKTIKLSEEEASLLKATASTPQGSIYLLRHIGGASIRAGKESFGDGGGREFAKWEAALENLIALGLVVARGYKGDVFELTHQGWSAADQL